MMNEGWSRTTRYLALIIVLIGLALLLFAVRALIGRWSLLPCWHIYSIRR